MTDSLEQLAKSQFFDTSGRSLGTGANSATGAPGGQSVTLRLDNTVIDQKYKVIGLIGEGGMGAVYKAHHLMLDKDVALKTFKSTNLTGEAWQRFQREAQAIARLSHINIVQVFDFGISEHNLPYYTMEYLSGQSLAERLASGGPLAVDPALRIFLQVCLGLSEAHSKKILHRDLKPANIFLTTDLTSDKIPVTKIVDFGVAGLALGSLDSQKLTTTGSIFGSPLYMSPEQSLGEPLTESSDIYSCGCALYETLTGSPPYRGENSFATMLQHQQKNIPRLSDKTQGQTFSRDLETLVDAMLEKDARKRISSFNEVAEELSCIIAGKPTRRRFAKNRSALTAVADETDLADDNDENPSEKDLKQQTKLLAVAACAVLLMIGGIICFPLLSKKTQQAAPGSIQSQSLAVPAAEKNYNNEPDLLVDPSRQYLISHGPLQYRKDNPKLLADSTPAKEFDFPGPQSLGLLTWTLFPPIANQAAKFFTHSGPGRVSVPKGHTLTLKASEEVGDNPGLLHGFGPFDLTFLDVRQTGKWGDTHMTYLDRMTYLIGLYLDGTQITEKSIDRINRLQCLLQFEARDTKLSARAISKLERLPRYYGLALSKTRNLSGSFISMKDSPDVRTLELNCCDLSDDDMRIFGTVSNLVTLDVGGNPKITDKGIEALSNLKDLYGLKISNTSATIKCLTVLSKLPKLHYVRVGPPHWSEADKNTLSNALPNCRVEWEDSVTNEEIEKWNRD